MSLAAVNRALQPHALIWQRLLLTFAAVGALLVGLLAMHSFSADTGHHGTAVVAVTEAHHEHDVAPAVVQDDCGGSCEPGHSMTVTACLLALLVLTMLLSARDLPIRGLMLLATSARHAQWWHVRAVRWPKRPSLLELSISRT